MEDRGNERLDIEECVDGVLHGIDEVEDDADDPVDYNGNARSTSVASVIDQGWVDGNFFYREVSEYIGRDDFNKLPTTETHQRLLAESYHLAATNSNRTVVGGLYDGQLVSKILIDGKVVYKYCVLLQPE